MAIDQLIISPTSSQVADIKRNMIKSSGTVKSSADPSSRKTKSNRNAAIVSPEANSYESEYGEEEYDSEEESESKTK